MKHYTQLREFERIIVYEVKRRIGATLIYHIDLEK